MVHSVRSSCKVQENEEGWGTSCHQEVVGVSVPYAGNVMPLSCDFFFFLMDYF